VNTKQIPRRNPRKARLDPPATPTGALTTRFPHDEEEPAGLKGRRYEGNGKADSHAGQAATKATAKRECRAQARRYVQTFQKEPAEKTCRPERPPLQRQRQSQAISG
jgi:hypothetical protein